MAWLGTWAYRRKFTVEADRVDATYTGVIPVVISASAGIGDDDISSIFDEVGASYKKIAITLSDGTTELTVEVEKWDVTYELARLFIRSEYDLSSDTEFYLYYDSTEGDNPNILDPGDATALYPTGSDEYWEYVHHLAEDGVANFIDSTNQNHDSADYVVTARQQDGLEGGHAVDIVSGDYINIGDIDVEGLSEFTVIVVANPDGQGVTESMIGCWPATDQWFFGTGYSDPNYRWRLLVYDTDGLKSCNSAYGTCVAATWAALAAQWKEDNETQIWKDGSSLTVGDTPTAPVRASDPAAEGDDIGAAGNSGTDLPFDGQIDEVWFANTKLADTYIKTLMYGFQDNLLNWFAEEEPPTGGWPFIIDTIENPTSVDGTLNADIARIDDIPA